MELNKLNSKAKNLRKDLEEELDRPKERHAVEDIRVKSQDLVWQ